jgi:hypothetical protein
MALPSVDIGPITIKHIPEANYNESWHAWQPSAAALAAPDLIEWSEPGEFRHMVLLTISLQ